MNITQLLVYYHLRKEIDIPEYISSANIYRNFDDIINVGYNIKSTGILQESLIKNNIEYCLCWHMDIEKLYGYLKNNTFINRCISCEYIAKPRYFISNIQDYIWCINSESRIYITYKNSTII